MTVVLKVALRDVLQGALRWNLWMSLAWSGIRQRYARTIFGPFWMTLSSGIFILAFGLIYSYLLNQDIHSYLPYITAGFLPWILFSTLVTESCTVFTAEKQAIANWQFPYSIFVYRLLCRNLIIFFHNLLIFLIVYMIYGAAPSWSMLWVPVGLVLFGLNGLWIALLLGTLCARFRDIQPLVLSVLQITMFVTPIFWRPEMLGKNRVVFVDGNFIYHMITVIRDPLLGTPPSTLSLTVCITCAAVGIALALVLYGRCRRRIPFWV